jgi:putative sterol carrier protein
MAYFDDANEVYHYLGGVFRAADAHPLVGPRLRASELTFRIDYSNPTATLTIRMLPGGIEIIEGPTDIRPDVRLAMSADNGDRFWRGEYNAAVGLALGEVRARGPVSKLLSLLPLAKPVFPLYQEMIAAKDRSARR